MKGMVPYLAFGGRCEEAFNFYADVFGGRIKVMIRFGDAMPDTPPEQKNLLVHAEFEAGNLHVMGTDARPPNAPAYEPNGAIVLALAPDSIEEQDRVWNKLADGGTVRQPLHTTFYGGRLGVVSDRFGIFWMLNYAPAPT